MERLLKWNFTRNFGLEFEFENSSARLHRMATIVQNVTQQNAVTRSYAQSRDNYATWECKTDSSCGIELVSPILSGPSKLKKATEVLEKLKENDFKISNKCGQHVHVEIKDFTEEQLGIMAMYWMKIERFILNGTPGHRRSNNYCALLTQTNRSVAVDRNYTPNEVLRNMASGRNAINFQNKSSRGTVEFRFGEMTFDPEVIKNRVRFLIWFVEMCKILPAPNNLNWMSPKQVMKTFHLQNNPKSIIIYKYSSAIQSMRKWLLSRVIEFAPVAFEKDKRQCQDMILEVETSDTVNTSEEQE